MSNSVLISQRFFFLFFSYLFEGKDDTSNMSYVHYAPFESFRRPTGLRSQALIYLSTTIRFINNSIGTRDGSHGDPPEFLEQEPWL